LSSKALAPLLITAGIIIAFLFFLNNQMTKEIKKLRGEVDQNREINLKIRKRLKELLESEAEIDPQVSQELTQIYALLEIKQETKAVLSLAKIIERLLKELYKDDAELHSKKKNLSFFDYLEHAKEKGIISEEDFHLISVLRLIRNQEAHELNVKKDESKILASFVAGLIFLFTLNKLVRKRISKSMAGA
jgi:hypothetical protein